MTEMIGTTINIGGHISLVEWQTFVREARSTGWDMTEFEILPDETLYWSDELNYGNFDDIFETCVEAGLSVAAHSDARYEWDGHLKVWHPGIGDPRESGCTQSGLPLIPLTALKSECDAGRNLADVMRDLEPLMREVPALRINGKPVTNDDLRGHWQAR